MKNTYLHISTLLDLMQEQEPERAEVMEQLKSLGDKKYVRQAYIYLLSPEQRKDEEVKESITLEHEVEGTLVLDVLSGGRLLGVELVNCIPFNG